MPRPLSFVLIFAFSAALSAAAQSPDTSWPTPPAQSQDSQPPADAPKPKKVWTNDNVAGAKGAVSVVGDPNSKPKPASPKPSNAQYAASVRKQIEKLQAQIDDIDKQLVDLKNFSEGEPSTFDLGKRREAGQKLQSRTHRGTNARAAE